MKKLLLILLLSILSSYAAEEERYSDDRHRQTRVVKAQDRSTPESTDQITCKLLTGGTYVIHSASTITTLNLYGILLESTMPLQALVNLTELDLGGNNLLLSISGIARLPNLRHLELAIGEEIADIELVGQLTTLTYLNLRCVFNGNNDSSLSFLASLTELVHLDLSSNDSLYDLTPLGSLKKLTWLSLRESMNCMRVNQGGFNSLGELSELEFLDLSVVIGINDLNFLRRLPKLTQIIIGSAYGDIGEGDYVTRERVSFLPDTVTVSQ